MTEIQGNRFWFRVSARFELARVRVSEGSSYRESTVLNINKALPSVNIFHELIED